MSKGTARVLISFGANIDPLENLRQGLSRLRREVELVAVSTVYRTTPLGLAGQPDFLNGAALVETDLEPPDLVTLLKRIEATQKRERGPDPNAPRTLDLDIALFDDRVIDGPTGEIPDPDLLERAFLAVTLAELAPEMAHPGDEGQGRTLGEIAAGFGDSPAGMQRDEEATATLQGLV